MLAWALNLGFAASGVVAVEPEAEETTPTSGGGWPGQAARKPAPFTGRGFFPNEPDTPVEPESAPPIAAEVADDGPIIVNPPVEGDIRTAGGAAIDEVARKRAEKAAKRAEERRKAKAAEVQRQEDAARLLAFLEAEEAARIEALDNEAIEILLADEEQRRAAVRRFIELRYGVKVA